MAQINGYAAKSKGSELEKWSYQPRKMRDIDVEIEITHSGVCGTDIHTIDSGWSESKYPFIPGHEIVGKVTKKGKSSTLNIGDRVGVGPFCDSCMKCEYCNNGESNICPEVTMTYNDKYKDDQGGETQGGYADKIIVNSKFAVKIPDSISSAEAAPLLCAGITTYAPLKRLNVKKGTKVGVIGIGGLGHIAIQWAAAMGAEVYTFSTSSDKKEEAEKLGSKNFVLEDKISEKQLNLDVILCTNASKKLDWNENIKQLKPKGTFVIIGLPEYKPEIDMSEVAFREINIMGSVVGSPELTREMLEKAVEYNVRPWIEEMKISECNKAIKKVRDNEVRYRVVLVN